MFLNLPSQEIRETRTRLADMLGTYVWVFSGDPEWGGGIEEMHISDYKDDTAFIAKHSITLGAAKQRPGRSVVPKDVSGHIAWGTLKVTFDRLQGVRRGRSSKAADVESYWEVVLTEDQEDSESARWLDTEGNAVGASVVLDDNGSPFLVFEWHLKGGGHSSWSGYYLGKRAVKGKEWRFTGEEQGRLGIDATFREVEQSVKGGNPSAYEEDEGEEEDYYGRGDASERSEEEAVEERRKESTDERAAKKSKGSTDERGARKRKGRADESERDAKKRKVSTDERGSKKRNSRNDERGAGRRKGSTDERGAKKRNASADERGGERRRERRRRRA